MIGDHADIVARLKRVLPPWFLQAPLTQLLDAVLAGPAALLSGLYSLYVYAQLQTRIRSAMDGFLDLIALDFFGSRITRGPSQADGAFLQIILASLFQARNTRAAIIASLQALTGRTPVLLEPWNPGDTGVLDGPGFYWDFAGAWGSPVSELPYQGFVTAFRPQTPANADLAGWDVPTGGWDAGNLFWAEEHPGAITDADIIAAVEAVRMGNTRIWLQIADNPQTHFFTLDNSLLDGPYVLQ